MKNFWLAKRRERETPRYGVRPPTKHIRTKSDEAFIDANGTWDQSAGDRVCKFLETFITLENGEPFVPLPYQRDFIESVYCWIRPDGRRRVKLALCTLGRKNGKTALLTGLTGYHLLADGDTKPKVGSCAVDREQASQIFEGLNFSRSKNQKLAECLRPVASQKVMYYDAAHGSYRSLSSDATGAGKLGTGYGFVVYDELAFHRNDGLWTSLQNSGDSKPNSLQIIISTAGWNKNGVFYRQYQYGKDVLNGTVIDTSFMPWVFETADGADLDNPDTWRHANPGLGVTLNEDDFRQGWERAKRDTAGKLDWMRLKFNSWTEAETTWLPVEKWESCRGPFPDLDGAPCHIGLDMGHTTDLAAVTAVFPVGGKFYVRSWGFVPEAAKLNREKQNSTSYDRFVLDGSLKVIPGDCISTEGDIYPLLNELIDRYSVQSLTVDPWQCRQLSQHYMQRGINVRECPPFHSRQNEPTQAVERAIMNQTLVHDGNSLLRWQVGHAQRDTDTKGYVKLTKPSAAQKIDNLQALVLAFCELATQEAVPEEDSIYNTRKVFTF